MGYRITTHKARTTKNGTAFSARHLDRHFDITKATHIDPTRSHLNRYVQFTVDDEGTLYHAKSKNLQAHELNIYNRLFKERLDAVNTRYIAQRHKEKCKTLNQYYRSPQSCPDEYLIYIGDKDNHVSSETLASAASELIRVLQKKYPDNFIPLAIALHRDELGIGEDGEGAHLHFRCVWICSDKDGKKASITKGMKEAGIQLPDEDSETKRSNNRQMTFSQEIRDTFADICEQRFGLEIEREARDASQSGKDLATYQRDQSKLDKERLQSECSELRAVVAQEVQEAVVLKEQVEALTDQKDRLETKLERLKAVLLPIQKLFAKLASIRIGKHSALDEVLLDAEITPAYDALQKLERC